MAQGTRSKKTGTIDDDLLDLDVWLAERKLAERRVKVGGREFRFTGSGTPETLAEFNAAYNVAPLPELLAILLVDRGEADELAAAFKVQREPLGKIRQGEFVNAIVAYVLAGVDVGESSAS